MGRQCHGWRRRRAFSGVGRCRRRSQRAGPKLPPALDALASPPAQVKGMPDNPADYPRNFSLVPIAKEHTFLKARGAAPCSNVASAAPPAQCSLTGPFPTDRSPLKTITLSRLRLDSQCSVSWTGLTPTVAPTKTGTKGRRCCPGLCARAAKRNERHTRLCIRMCCYSHAHVLHQTWNMTQAGGTGVAYEYIAQVSSDVGARVLLGGSACTLL